MTLTERLKNKDRMRKIRAATYDIGIPTPPANPRRRELCRQDPERFCREYFPSIFYHPFSQDQKKIIESIRLRLTQGGYQALATARGDGKSTITRVVGGVWGIVYGYISYLVLLGANGTFAKAMIGEIKRYYEFNDALHEDFNEITRPVRALQGSSQRARTQTCMSRLTRLSWTEEEIVFARIAGSLASGSIIVCKGVDAAIRGLVRDGKRPDLIIGDDLETKESVRSITQTQKIRETLEMDVLGLAGPGEQLAVVLLGTIMKAGSIIDCFTDRSEMPAWYGIRQKFLIHKPEREDLWNIYMNMRKSEQVEGDTLHRRSRQFYKDNQIDMDRGSAVNNPCRYDKERELSALQHAYNKICDMGWDNFAAELQNEPVLEANESTDIKAEKVCKRVNGKRRGVVPPGTARITAAIDVKGRALNWTVIAWNQAALGWIIDYGEEPVHSPIIGAMTSDENKRDTEQAILNALLKYMEWERDNGYPEEDTGLVRHIDFGLVDAGWLPDPVYAACKAQPAGRWRPSKGLGRDKTRYRPPSASDLNRKQGNHWYCSRGGINDLWLYNLDANFWKNQVHSGFLLPIDQPGALTLFGEDKLRFEHLPFAEQICAEVWTREYIAGKGWVEGFKVISRHNHWLDATAGALAAAGVLGIKPLPTDKTKPNEFIKPAGRWSEIQAAKKALGGRR